MTTSVTDPRPDIEINAPGTFNTLEAARDVGDEPIFFYTGGGRSALELSRSRTVGTEPLCRYGARSQMPSNGKFA